MSRMWRVFLGFVGYSYIQNGYFLFTFIFGRIAAIAILGHGGWLQEGVEIGPAGGGGIDFGPGGEELWASGGGKEGIDRKKWNLFGPIFFFKF